MELTENLEKLQAGEIEYQSWFAPSPGELEYRSWLDRR